MNKDESRRTTQPASSCSRNYAIDVLLVVLAGALLLTLIAPLATPRIICTIPTPQAAISRNGPFARALEFYRRDMGTYPEGHDGLRKLIYKPKDPNGAKRWGGPYLAGEEDLLDPWGNSYRYRFPGEINENTYELWCVGPDGKDGTEDDITRWPPPDQAG